MYTAISYRATGIENQQLQLFRLHDSSTIPSAIAYSTENDTYYIGHEAVERDNCVYWIKHMFDQARILFDSNDELIGSLVQHSLQHVPDTHRQNPSLVAMDFLKRVLTKLRDEIDKYDMPQDFIFTVPTIWSQASYAMMREAVTNAGFLTKPTSNVHFITEAEAAAQYAASGTVYGMQSYNQVSTTAHVTRRLTMLSRASQ